MACGHTSRADPHLPAFMETMGSSDAVEGLVVIPGSAVEATGNELGRGATCPRDPPKSGPDCFDDAPLAG